MRLQSLTLQQFRSYPSLEIAFGERDLHVLQGPNAAGKTNLLEAVAILSSGRSFLGAEEDDLMTWGTDHYRIRAEVRSDVGEGRTIEVVSQRLPRRARAGFVNDVRLPIGRLTGVLPAISFLPQDLSLFLGSPSRRRDLLNDLLVQVSPAFAASLATYQKLLKQRNALLRRIREGTGRTQDLVVWEEGLAREGAVITFSHLELLKVLQLSLEEELRALGESWQEVRLAYDRHPSARSGSSLSLDGRATTREGIEAELKHDLLHFRERDLLIGSTTIGPHRSDWRIDADGRSLASFASRGQQRTAVLALLFLQVSYMEVRRGEKPLILLDDVFSELDSVHQERLMASFKGHQVLLTTTHVPPSLAGAKLWVVGEGKVMEQGVGLGRRE
ncbi:MAG: DNA replication and repair protein RecF [Candidatus Peribacteraceae bacterium]|nr:DNA replication and repair protein RecF [Candidatus Peribacteraceae bacterium]MDD5739272.1 DNA replication and repair protein RecF [Candidatus Peribacteraceae bacterium]